MDSLFEILFVALILLAPFLEAMFKRRKQGPPGDEEESGGRTVSRAGTAEADRRAPADRPTTPADRPTTSEGLIPAEIWEELTGVRTAPEKETAPPGEAVEDEASWWEDEEEEEVAGGGAVGTEEIGTDEIGTGGIRGGEIRAGGARGRGPSRREPTEVTAKQAELAARFEEAEARRAAPGGPLAPGRSVWGSPARGGGRARRLLAGASRRRLQDAILLKEILGPPVSERGGGPTSRPGPSS